MTKINISNDGNSVSIDGVIYDKRKTEEKEPELKTFEDCWNKVKPHYLINSNNSIVNSYHYSHPSLYNCLPTEKSAKQIQAAIKLFVVSHALQGEYNHYDNGKNYNYGVYLKNGTTLEVSHIYQVYSPFSFKDEETALKAIDIAKDIFLEYFGIENK